MTTPVTARDRAKAERSDAIRHEAALLFAEAATGSRRRFSRCAQESNFLQKDFSPNFRIQFV